MDNPKNTISYAEGWKQANAPVYYEKHHYNSEPDTQEKKNKKQKTQGKPLLIIIQMIICLLILIVAYGIKLFSGDLYTDLHNLYTEKLNDEIIMTQDPKAYSLDSLIELISGDKA